MDNDTPLQGREIRLLYLLHNQCGAVDIGYNLLRTTIDCAPPYEALSYAWGEEKWQVTLRNGALVTMTTNLYHALRFLQRPHASRLLWIDAVCINQNDDTERSQQAQFMNQIYAMADRVVVWLGEAGDHTSRAFEILSRGYQALARDDHLPSSRSMQLTPEEKTSIWGLIERPYFNRTWVLQEMMVARTVLVMWSQSTMPFETLVAACDIIEYTESPWSDFNFACQTIKIFGKLRQVFNDPTADRSSLGLTQLLLYMHGNKAKDPRDKVFALFGITHEGYETTPARPDYGRAADEVYTSVARFLIEDDHSLQVLSAVQHAHTGCDLPSWVPDWRVEYPIRLLDAAQEYLNYRLHGERVVYPVVTCIPAPQKLALGGFSFDVVRATDHDQLDHDIVDDDDRKLFYSSHDRCRIASIFGHEEIYPPTEEDVEIAWLRTISAALFPDWKQLKTWYARARYPQYVSWKEADLAANVPPKEVVGEIFSFVRHWTRGRKTFITQGGYLGLGPAEVEPGDVVCILFGGNLPYVVRALDEDEFTFLGPCYVHGIMNGKAYHGHDQTQNRTFVFV